MPAKRYIVRLSLAERQQLIQLVKTGKAAAYKRQRAQILLNADVSPEGPGLKDETIAQNLGVCQGTVERLRKRFVEVGFDQVLERVRRQHSRPRCLNGEQEAYLVALSCSEAPQGHNRSGFKKTLSNLGSVKNGAFQPNKTRPLFVPWKIS